MEQRTYSIGEVSRMFGLPISTIRYYDRQGLLPGLEKNHGIRVFTDNNLEAMRVIQCLKASGLEICDIQKFMELAQMGSSTFHQRKEIFEKRKEVLEETIAGLQRELDMIRFKCWFYQMAEELEDNKAVLAMIPDGLPEDILAAYESSHQTIGSIPFPFEPEEESK